MYRVDCLDYIKGVGCSAVVIGYSFLLNDCDQLLLDLCSVIPSFTCFVLTLLAVTACFQVGRRPLIHHLAYFAILFLLALTYVSIRGGLWLFDFYMEILQIVVFDGVLVVFFYRFFQVRWALYLLSALGVFLNPFFSVKHASVSGVWFFK